MGCRAFLVKNPHKGEAGPGSLDSWHLDVPARGQPMHGLGESRPRLLSPCSGLVPTPGEPGRAPLSVFLLPYRLHSCSPSKGSCCATAGADQNGNGGFVLCFFPLRGCLLPPECHCISAEWVVPPVQSSKRHWCYL